MIRMGLCRNPLPRLLIHSIRHHQLRLRKVELLRRNSKNRRAGNRTISQISIHTNMVELLCPHCEEEIELDDDASGEFACPYCQGEFEWNVEPAFTTSQGDTTVSFNGDDSSLGTYAIVAVVLGSIGIFTGFCTAGLPIVGLCNLLIVIPAGIISFMNRNKLEQFPATSHKGMVNAGFWLAVAAFSITILAQIFWIIMILIAPESSGEWFQCADGFGEIPIEFVNDGEADCFDGSDEGV